MSHDYLWRYKREIHFELRKTSFKRSLAFTLQMLAEGIECATEGLHISPVFYTCPTPNFDCDGDDNVRQIKMIYSVSMFLTTQTFSESCA